MSISDHRRIRPRQPVIVKRLAERDNVTIGTLWLCYNKVYYSEASKTRMDDGRNPQRLTNR